MLPVQKLIEALIEKSGAGFCAVTIRSYPSVVYGKDFVTRFSEIREFVLSLIVIVQKKEIKSTHM